MDTAKIAALLEPFVPKETLGQNELDSISIYIDILVRWNARMNLTAVRDPEQIVRRHFGESLFAASRLLPGRARHRRLSLIDVGSGAGFPGVPIRMWAPNLEAILIESQNRKATFLREVIRAVRLTNVNVFQGRAEICSARADLVTLRAVEKFESVVAVAGGLVRRQDQSQASLPSGDWSADTPSEEENSSGFKGRLALLIAAAQIPKAKQLLAGSEWQWDEPVAIPESAARVMLVARRRPGNELVE